MELLGKYDGTISSYLYSSLLELFTQNVTQKGDNGGVLNISNANILALVNEADTTSSLPIPSFNSKSNEEQINYPIDLLLAKYTAIQNEIAAFTANSEVLLARLASEEALLDKLIYQAKLSYWISTLYPVLNAETFAWDYNQGLGLLSSDVGITYGGGTYTQNTNIQKVLNVNGTYMEGLMANGPVSTVPCSNLTWSYNVPYSSLATYSVRDVIVYNGISYVSLISSNIGNQPDISPGIWGPIAATGVITEIDGTSSTQISVLESSPQVVYNPTPSVQLLLPLGGSITGVFGISGDTSLGIISTYIRTGFYPRQNEIMLNNPAANTPINLSNYQVGPDTVTVFTRTSTGRVGTVFSSFTTYTVDDSSNITFLTVPVSGDIYIRFTEMYPYYQCSLNNTNWSPLVMLDPNRPYPDDDPNIHLIKIKTITGTPNRYLFPITDERGSPNGLYLEMTGIPAYAYLFQVSTMANPVWGGTSILECDMQNTGYLNGLTISPFVEFPMILSKVEVEGFGAASRTTIYTQPNSNPFELDSTTTIAFPTQLVKKIYITFAQLGYSPVDQQTNTVSTIRNQTMQQIQSILPVLARNNFNSTPQVSSGFEYDFGVENVVGINSSSNNVSVTVSGPFLVEGCPETFTYNSQTTGTVGEYLCYLAYNDIGTLIDSNTTGIAIANGTSKVVPYTGSLDRATVASVKFYLKYVLLGSNANASVARFYLQVTKR